MHCLLPMIALLIPLALAFPKHGGPGKNSKHHDDISKHHEDKTTSFPTLTLPSTYFTDSFPTGIATGTISYYPTAYPTGDFKARRDLGVLQGRKYKGKFNGTGTAGCAEPTGKKHGGKDY